MGPLWTEAYVTAASDGTASSHEHWRRDDIRAALARDAASKCMYCESRIADVSYPNVEHIRPKSEFPKEAHLWTNLGSACTVCNVEKGSYWSQGAEVIDPYTENPADFLVFHGDVVTPKTGSIRGRISRSTLKLQRAALLESRLARLEAVLKALEEWAASTGPLRSILALEIERDIELGEYTTSIATVVAKQGFVFSVDSPLARQFAGPE